MDIKAALAEFLAVIIFNSYVIIRDRSVIRNDYRGFAAGDLIDLARIRLIF